MHSSICTEEMMLKKLADSAIFGMVIAAAIILMHDSKYDYRDLDVIERAIICGATTATMVLIGFVRHLRESKKT